MMPSLAALKHALCPTGRAMIGAWDEVAEGGRGAVQPRQLLGIRKELCLHAGPCPLCHSEVKRWGGWHKLEDALNPIAPTADPEE